MQITTQRNIHIKLCKRYFTDFGGFCSHEFRLFQKVTNTVYETFKSIQVLLASQEKRITLNRTSFPIRPCVYYQRFTPDSNFIVSLHNNFNRNLSRLRILSPQSPINPPLLILYYRLIFNILV